MSKRLSDTEALTRQRINAPGARLAPYSADSADGAVSRNSLGQFRRETGAGDSSLSTAVHCANGYNRDKE